MGNKYALNPPDFNAEVRADCAADWQYPQGLNQVIKKDEGNQMMKRSVLITGCSKGGLAQELVKSFLGHGFLVLAALRDTSKAGELQNMDGVIILKLDVSSSASIKICFEEVQKITGGRLDVLFNNAGAGSTMPLLDVAVEEAKVTYESNVWGILGMTQAFAPMLIEAKGVICNVSSVLGEVVCAWLGIYGSSRAAGILMSETLRLEMAPLGVRVVTAVLGGISTYQNDTKNRADLVLPAGSLYEPIAPAINRHQKMEVFVKKQDIKVAAENIVNDVLGGRKSIIRRGEGSTMTWVANTFMPHGQVTALMNRESGLEGLHSPKTS